MQIWLSNNCINFLLAREIQDYFAFTLFSFNESCIKKKTFIFFKDDQKRNKNFLTGDNHVDVVMEGCVISKMLYLMETVLNLSD